MFLRKTTKAHARMCFDNKKKRDIITQKAVEEILKVKGILDAKIIPHEWRGRIAHLEEQARKQATKFVPFTNTGVRKVLSQQVLIVALHNPELRHPDDPTIILVSDGVIIGEEVWLKDKLEKIKGSSNRILIGESFVIHKRKAFLKKGRSSEFVYPPIVFKPLMRIKEIDQAMSASPNAGTDLYLRKMMEWDDTDVSLGTILIGFDFRKGLEDPC